MILDIAATHPDPEAKARLIALYNLLLPFQTIKVHEMGNLVEAVWDLKEFLFSESSETH